MSLEPVSVKEVLEQALELTRPIAEKAAVTVTVGSSIVDGVSVMADRQRLLQVIINLISNGVKFNRPDGRIDILCEETEEFCRILIRDSGYGITELQREKLFQPFERFGDAGIEGTGLGLVLSRNFVELMGGKLELAESSPEGSTFSVTLRGASATVPDVTVDSSSRVDGKPEKLGRVLYIEDNLSNLRLVEMLLEDWPGVRLIPAMQAHLGLELAESHNPDLILLDLHLPDMPGEEVLHRLKASEATRAIPVVVITADAVGSHRQELRAAGAAGYMTKPLDIHEFLEMLKTYLDAD